MTDSGPTNVPKPAQQTTATKPLTSGDIDKLEAGAELDLLVARHAIAANTGKPGKGLAGVANVSEVTLAAVFKPSANESTGIALLKRYPGLMIACDGKGQAWAVWLPGQWPGEERPAVSAATFPVAVCRAVLKHVLKLD